LHGEAVAIGLVMAARLSAELKHCTGAQAEQVEAVLKSHALPTALRAPLRLDPMLAAMRRDKKVRGGKLRFVLQDGVGAASTADDVPEEAAVRALLAGGAVR
jgi:3-dehydroquinate synthetase